MTGQNKGCKRYEAGSGVGRREEGGEKHQIRKWEKDIHDAQEKTSMEGSTCSHESHASYNSWQWSRAPCTVVQHPVL